MNGNWWHFQKFGDVPPPPYKQVRQSKHNAYKRIQVEIYFKKVRLNALAKKYTKKSI